MAEKNQSQEVSGNLNALQTIEEMERTLRIAKCLQGEPVCVLKERLAPHSGIGDLRKWATGVLKVFGEKAVNFEIGEIICDERSIKNSFAHGLNPFKVEAVRSIKDVIEQGVVFAQTKVGREEHYFIAAPVVIENKEDIVTILAKRDMNTQRMYLHSVATKESILNKDFSQNKTPETLVPSADTEVSERSGKLYSGDISRILQNYLKVNIRELEVEINQQIEQQKGNKMAQENENTAEQQISRQELNERFVEWSYEMVGTFEDYAEYNKVREQNPLMNVSDDILTDKEKELKNFHQALQGVELNPSITEKYGKLIDEIKEQSTAELSRLGWVEKTVDYPPIYSANNPYAAYAKDNEEVRQNADDWEMREPLTGEKLSHFNELAKKQGFTTYVENHHADTGVFQADKKIDETYSIEIIGQFKNHGGLDAFESARDFTMSFHQGDEIVHYFYTNQLDKALEQAAEFSKNPAQWIENKDKTVEQHLSDLVDETVAIMQKHSVIEQNRLPEKIPAQEVFSGNLKDKVKEVHQELAVESLDFQFTHTGLTEHNATINEKLNGLTAEQAKELTPYFEQHKAIQTLQDLYKQTGDSERLTEMQEHNRLLEWKIHNKVKGWTEKVADYADIDYYKGIDDNLAKMRKNGVLPDKEIEQRQPEKQSSVDEQKNFVQNQDNVNQTLSNSAENLTKNQEMPQNLIDNSFNGDISSPKIFQEKVMFATVPETQITQMIDEIAKSRTYLAVDFDNKDAAKAAGAKYDPQAKGWFAEEITPELRQFLPQQPENITAERKALSDFQRQAETIGLDMANFKEVFGSWQRVPIKGKGKTNADGGYKLYRNDDGSIGACAKNYSTGDSVAWNDRLKDGKQIQSKVPLPDYLANQKQKEWNTVTQHTAQSNVAAMRGEVAAKAYHQLQPALATDPYIQNKGISDIGKLKRLNDGSTIVPLYHNGKIANLQMIRPNGEKRLMSQAAKVGAYYSIGNTKTPQAVIVAEGVATADSVHQIASEIYGKDKVLVLAAIDSGNLHNVAAKVEQNFPQVQKMIAADNDAHNATRSELKFKNAGLDKANEVKEAYPNFQVALCPALNDEKGQVKNTDWNDFLKAHGKTEAVKAFAENDKYTAQQTTKQSSNNGKSNHSGMDGRE